MKRTLILAGALAATLAVNAQVTRMVLTEEFSNASCGPCAAQNPGYNTLVGANTSKVISLKYQTNWPGVDPMNAQTQSDVGPRVTYYGVSGVPHGTVDGTAIVNDCSYYTGAPACLAQADIDARWAVSSPFDITVVPALTPGFDSITVAITLNTPAAFSGTTMKLQVALVEKLVTFSSAPGTNGETVFHNVLRKDMNNANMAGFTIPNSWAAAESHTYNFTIAIPSFIYKHSEMAVVAFVQDNSSKEVHQAEIADVPVTSFGVTQNISATPLNCTSSVTGATAEFKNTGAVTITSATINYRVDGGTTMTIPYSGSLATGATTTVNIPTLTSLSSGAHTLETWVTNINSSGASGYMGLANKTLNIFTGAASATPLSQAFTNASFPYANWSLDNPNPAYSWARVATNSGSMKFDNYNYSAGTISNFIVEPVDMTSLTNANMTFDVAYKQYSTENDRLEVLVSTNCGASWTSVYNKAGSTLMTVAAGTAAFTPTAAQWRTETVDLSAYGSATQLFIKFKATSDYGNNLYVDKINILSAGSSGIEDQTAASFNVYPNPTSDYVNVSFMNAESVTFTLINSVGQTVKVFNNVNTNAQLSLEGLANGLYILNADINGQRITKQVIKK
jgi:hypothetical protein